MPGKRRTAAICPLEPPHTRQSLTNASAVAVTTAVDDVEEVANGMNLQRSFTEKRSKMRTCDKITMEDWMRVRAREQEKEIMTSR